MNLFQVVEMSHQLWSAQGRRNITTHLSDGKTWVCAPHVNHLIPINVLLLENSRHSAKHFKLHVFFVAWNKGRRQNQAYILNSRLFLLNSNTTDGVVYLNLIYVSDLLASIEALIHHSSMANPFLRIASSDFFHHHCRAAQHINCYTGGNWLD